MSGTVSAGACMAVFLRKVICKLSVPINTIAMSKEKIQHRVECRSCRRARPRGEPLDQTDVHSHSPA